MFCSACLLAQVPKSNRSVNGGDFDMDLSVEFPDDDGESYYTINVKGFYGVKYKGKFIIPPIYNKIYSTREGYVVVKNGKHGVYNRNAGLILPVIYDTLINNFMTGACYIARQNGRYGALSYLGEEILPVTFNKIIYMNPENNFAIVRGDDGKTVQLLNGKPLETPLEDITIYRNGVKARQNGKYGFIAKGAVTVPFNYKRLDINVSTNSMRDMSPYDFKIAVSASVIHLLPVNGDKFGLFDVTGKEILPVVYDKIAYETRIRTYFLHKERKVGIYCRNGQLIPCEYDYIKPTSYALLIMQKNGKASVYNFKGECILPEEYSKIEILDRGQVFKVTKDTLSGLVSKTGEVIVPLEYSHIDRFSYGSEHIGFYRIKKGNKTGLLQNNQLIIPAIYDGIYEKGDFYLVKNDSLWGLCDKKGQVILKPVSQKIINSPVSKSKVMYYMQDSLWGAIDFKGQSILQPEFIRLDYIHNSLGLFNFLSMNDYSFLYLKHQSGKYGILEENQGIISIPVKYDNILQKLDTKDLTYFIVQKGKKQGIIDQNNRILINFIYDSISFNGIEPYLIQSESDINIIVKKKNKYGLINLNNEIRIPLKYEILARVHHNNLFKAGDKDKLQLINLKNDILNPGPFTEIAQFESGKTLSFYNGQMRIIDHEGTFLSGPVPMKPHKGFTKFIDLKTGACSGIK